MNEYEKYFFDLNGYLVVEDVLTVDELAKLNESIDQNQEQIEEADACGRAGQRAQGSAACVHYTLAI